MSEDELVAGIDWVAHGFEIVHSVFPGWTFAAVDAVAVYGVHGALLLGDKHPMSEQLTHWREALSDFSVKLVRDDGLTRSGHARHVLGGPLKAPDGSGAPRAAPLEGVRAPGRALVRPSTSVAHGECDHDQVAGRGPAARGAVSISRA